MKPAVFLIGLALSMQPAAALAQAAEAAAAGDVEAARAAVAAIDLDRVYSDADYAREMLSHLDVAYAATDDREAELEIDSLRLAALGTLGGHDRIREGVDRILARRPTFAAPYTFAWWALITIPDIEAAVQVLDQASSLVPGEGWGELRETVGPQVPGLMLIQLERDERDATRLRLAEALFRIGWPGGGDLERSNDLRRILVDYRMEQNDRRAAAELAAGLSDPYSLLSLILLRRYDSLFANDAERIARLRTAIAEYDRLSREALEGRPSVGAAFDRARFLRRLGREREALAVLEPFTRDVPSTVAADYRGKWVINEASYALLNLGRPDEAVALMEQLLEVPIETDGDMIGPYINHSMILLEAGRPAEALAYATRLEREHARSASDYGKRLIDSSIVCALAALGRAGEAGPVLERLRASSNDQPAPLARAALCLGDMETVEATVISRLEGEHPESLLLEFQDYLLEHDGPRSSDEAHDRLLALRERPAVRQALERVGRVLQVPLARLDLGGN